MIKNFYSFILKSEIRGYKRTFASQFWIFWACFVYFFLISPGNTFEKRQQKQRLAFFSKLCWDENHNIKPDLIAKSQNIPLLIKKNTAKTKQLFKSDYNINEKKFLAICIHAVLWPFYPLKQPLNVQSTWFFLRGSNS